MRKIGGLLLLLIFVVSCKSLSTSVARTPKINFLDEFIIPKGMKLEGTTIGGLSGIDYDGQQFYIICDDPKDPRYYTATIDIVDDKIKEVVFTSVRRLKDSVRYLDLESIRFDVERNQVVITSEGNISRAKDPAAFRVDAKGAITQFPLPLRYKANSNEVRTNGVFEGLTIATDRKGYWFGMELPLVSDGPEPKLVPTKSPVRISYFDLEQDRITREFGYMLGPVSKVPKEDFMVNGLSEMLALDAQRFLIVERGYSSGLGQQGNTVKLFLANASNASNIVHLDHLINEEYVPATKELVIDLEDFRDRLTARTIDNIEGISFGPRLANGHRSLVLIADDNFSNFGKQFNQVILLELIE